MGDLEELSKPSFKIMSPFSISVMLLHPKSFDNICLLISANLLTQIIELPYENEIFNN